MVEERRWRRRQSSSGQVVGQGFQVDLVAQALRERDGDPIRVVVRAVEASIDGMSHAPHDGLEQGEDSEGRSGDRDRLALGELGQHGRQGDHSDAEGGREQPVTIA